MDKNEIISRITSKKDFSGLPLIDVEMAYEKFARRQVSEEEKIRLTREVLHKTFGAFSSKKLLSPKDKDELWILRKHISTRERLGSYREVYSRIFKDVKKASVLDLGAGVNGFSYKFFKEAGVEVNYTSVESVGQLTELTNSYFEKNNLSDKCRSIHESLFNIERIKSILSKQNKPRFVFLFKVLDSLEMVERDFSKKLLQEVVPLSEVIVVSFATESMAKRKKFKVKRNWIVDFIKENFSLLDDFEISGERYICFENKKDL